MTCGPTQRLPSLLGNQRQLPDGRVMPDSVRQCQHVTAVHFTVTLVAGCEVQQGEGITCPLRLRCQGRRTNYRHNAVMENDPVGFLTEESRGGYGEQTVNLLYSKVLSRLYVNAFLTGSAVITSPMAFIQAVMFSLGTSGWLKGRRKKLILFYKSAAHTNCQRALSNSKMLKIIFTDTKSMKLGHFFY